MSVDNALKDYTPTVENISLHGLGFIQVKLPANKRLHVWHPDLPRRTCYAHSAIHNHRFSFESLVLKGEQINRRWSIALHPKGSHDVISHDGPRSPKGGRESFVAARANVVAESEEIYRAGQYYSMPALAYHDTPNADVVVTLMTKISEVRIHANSLIEHGHTFDQNFDRFQLTPERLWAIVIDALNA